MTLYAPKRQRLTIAQACDQLLRLPDEDWAATGLPAVETSSNAGLLMKFL